jgi:hypothetical protein
LTKSKEKETIIINRLDRSTYPDRKSVLTSGATPLAHAGVCRDPIGDVILTDRFGIGQWPTEEIAAPKGSVAL